MTFPLLGDEQLQALGMDAAQSRRPTSDRRFPDGGAWRIEIPSVEGPEPLQAILDEAARLDVPVHRVSQGSGVMMLDDGEITEMLALTAEHGVELCLFLGPAARGTSAPPHVPHRVAPDCGPAGEISSGSASPSVAAPPTWACATCSWPTRACCGQRTVCGSKATSPRTCD